MYKNYAEKLRNIMLKFVLAQKSTRKDVLVKLIRNMQQQKHREQKIEQICKAYHQQILKRHNFFITL